MTRWLLLILVVPPAALALAVDKARLETFTVAKADDRYVRHSEGAAIELKDGSILLIWQEFTRGTGDSDFFPNRLVAKTSRDGGHTWGGYRVIATPEPGDLSVFSPSLLRLADGAILLVFMRTHSFDKAKNVYPPYTGVAWISRDEGKTFRPQGTPWKESMNSMASSVAKRTSAGRILVPVSRDVSRKGQPDHWVSGVVYSDDGGKTWAESTSWVDVAKRGAMEAHVEELKDGRILMVMRTQLGHIYQAISADGGKTWGAASPTSLRSPESCPDLVRIPKTGDLLLIWNNSPYDPKYYSHFGKRTPLSTAISKDDGKTWGHFRNLETNPNWAFTNPGCCFTSKGTLLVNYWACKYQPNGAMSNFPIDLKLAVLDVEWLYQGEDGR